MSQTSESSRVSAEISAFMDESGTHAGSAALVVAGYIFRAGRLETFNSEWRSALNSHGLEHFHMVDCVHGNGAFKGVEVVSRSNVARQFIETIKRHAEFGFAVSVSEVHYVKLMPKVAFFGSAYSFCARAALSICGAWFLESGVSGVAKYCFEAGHSSQSQANAILSAAVRDTVLRERWHYGSHEFVSKQAAPGVQAADILAWLSRNFVERRLRGDERIRKDLASLLEARHKNLHITPGMLFDWRNDVQSAAESIGMTQDEFERRSADVIK